MDRTGFEGHTSEIVRVDRSLSGGIIRDCAGGHDQPCGALGAGIVHSGEAMNATGTSDVICPAFDLPLLTQDMLENNYCCYNHVNPQQYVSVAFNLTGGLLLLWLRVGKPEE